MVEWFHLIHEKQLLLRLESELMYKWVSLEPCSVSVCGGLCLSSVSLSLWGGLYAVSADLVGSRCPSSPIFVALIGSGTSAWNFSRWTCRMSYGG